MREITRVSYSAKVREKPVVKVTMTQEDREQLQVQYGHDLRAKRMFWREMWTRLFALQTVEELHQWESDLNLATCNCGSFYQEFRKQNAIGEKVEFEWKWKLKSAVNEKLGKPNISLDQARWLYRFAERSGPVHHLVTLKDLIEDTKHLTRLIYSRHSNLAGVAGVARSGMLPATQIALDLGVDLYEATVDGCRLVSGGVRRTGTLHGTRRVDEGLIIIVDDSTCSGYAWDRLKHLNQPFYTVYAGQNGKRVVDGYVVPLELPHFFEWNLFHNGIVMAGCKAAFDLDGVFCEDCPMDCDDDGPRYLDWMRRVQPLQWNIEYEVPLIVTARREVYREQTLDWLKRHGIRVKEIVMFPGSFEERAKTNIGQWKASMVSKRGCGLFVESDYRQACEIAKALPNCQVVSIERPGI